MRKSDSLDALLNVFWLRPETALWRELDIRTMADFQFRSPSLDLGCGDGIFSFIRGGGRFDSVFDAFQVMSGLDKFFENVDVFDAFDELLSPIVVHAADYQIDCGFDHKDNLLKKASKLGLYKSLQQGDANAALPFSDESFYSIFSNILYWLDDPSKTLKEISRVLKPEGRACFMLPNITLPQYSFFNTLYVQTGDARWAFLEKLDRGRFNDNIRQARSSADWENMFSNAGLKIISHRQHLSKTVIQLWDIGMRPLFPVLLRMAKGLDKDLLSSIKEDWVRTLRQFLEPIILMDADLSEEHEPAFHCYVLECI